MVGGSTGLHIFSWKERLGLCEEAAVGDHFRVQRTPNPDLDPKVCKRIVPWACSIGFGLMILHSFGVLKFLSQKQHLLCRSLKPCCTQQEMV